MKNDLDKITKIINGEDRPDDLWFIDTINALCGEIEELRRELDKTVKQLQREDV